MKKALKRLGDTILDVMTGDIIIKRGWDRHIRFVVYLFFLISCYLLWNLWVEDKLVKIKNNDADIEQLKVVYYKNNSDLMGLDQRSKVEQMLSAHGLEDLHAPADPPMTIVVK
ncbi:MAG: hypothetical protein HUJ93_01785 [Bacteroidales bacterium]|nr:hypothetical protein [Bacteroidales bacterium]